MASSSSEDFDLFEALCSQPDLLELVVQQCSGNKNNLRLSCSRLRLAVDACVIGLAWTGLDPLVNEAKRMAVLARCPRLQTVDFNGRPVADLSPLAACAGLRSLDCSHTWVQDLAPLTSCAELRSLDCRDTLVEDLMPLLACTRLEMLECSDFDVINVHARQLRRARPDLNIIVSRSHDDDDDDSEEDD